MVLPPNSLVNQMILNAIKKAVNFIPTAERLYPVDISGCRMDSGLLRNFSCVVENTYKKNALPIGYLSSANGGGG